MLYENEKVQIWNPETDEAFQTDEEKLEIEEIRVRIEAGKQLEGLKQSEGWKSVSTFLTSSVDAYKDILTKEQDFKKIRRLQEAIKAYSNVLSFIDVTIAEGKNLQENHQTPEDQG